MNRHGRIFDFWWHEKTAVPVAAPVVRLSLTASIVDRTGRMSSTVVANEGSFLRAWLRFSWMAWRAWRKRDAVTAPTPPKLEWDGSMPHIS